MRWLTPGDLTVFRSHASRMMPDPRPSVRRLRTWCPQFVAETPGPVSASPVPGCLARASGYIGECDPAGPASRYQTVTGSWPRHGSKKIRRRIRGRRGRLEDVPLQKSWKTQTWKEEKRSDQFLYWQTSGDHLCFARRQRKFCKNGEKQNIGTCHQIHWIPPTETALVDKKPSSWNGEI